MSIGGVGTYIFIYIFFLKSGLAQKLKLKGKVGIIWLHLWWCSLVAWPPIDKSKCQADMLIQIIQISQMIQILILFSFF